MQIVGYAAVLAAVMSPLGLWVAIQKRRNPAEGFVLGGFAVTVATAGAVLPGNRLCTMSEFASHSSDAES